MSGIEALNNSNILNYVQSISNSPVTVSDFKKILSAAASQQTEKTETFVSAEHSLKEIYPGLKYQVLDASQFTYFNRLDFPTSKLYGDIIDETAINQLKSWKPESQTSNGFEPWVQAELEKIPIGAHVVLIHPAVQKKMEQDTDYAKKIVTKIQKYFDDDIRINAAIDPESVKSMSQLVSITEDGEIGFHETVCDGPSAKSSDSEKTETLTQAKYKKQNLSNESLIISLANALPVLEEMQAASIQQEYNYAYQVFGLSQKRKVENGEII
ncbi:hypothetical protein AALB39_05325 [Lachnospiraceae bacterium 54-53]